MSLAFPDVNVWFALASEEHIQHRVALDWWKVSDERIAFCRFTQLGFLRLLTTAAAMNQRPLSMKQAWSAYDAFSKDERVEFVTEPVSVDRPFRGITASGHASPKLWADAYLIAFAFEHGASVVTFDRSLARRSSKCRLLD